MDLLSPWIVSHDPLSTVRNWIHNAMTILGAAAAAQWFAMVVLADSHVAVPIGISTNLGIAGVVIFGVSKGIDSANNVLSKFAAAKAAGAAAQLAQLPGAVTSLAQLAGVGVPGGTGATGAGDPPSGQPATDQPAA